MSARFVIRMGWGVVPLTWGPLFLLDAVWGRLYAKKTGL